MFPIKFTSMTKSILIIEDDRDTSEMLGYLAELLNFTAITSIVTLSIPEIQSLSPNLILLDHYFSGKLGGDLCLELKSASQTKHIPIILMSAASNIGRIAKNSHADHFISKPFDINDLQECILKYMS